MNKEKLDLLKKYLKTNIAPILIQDVDITFLKKDAIILPANIKKSSLNGTLLNGKLNEPHWYNEIKNKCQRGNGILIISDLSKYRKIGVLELPKNCVILLNGKLDELNDNIKSLVITL